MEKKSGDTEVSAISPAPLVDPYIRPHVTTAADPVALALVLVVLVGFLKK